MIKTKEKQMNFLGIMKLKLWQVLIGIFYFISVSLWAGPFINLANEYRKQNIDPPVYASLISLLGLFISIFGIICIVKKTNKMNWFLKIYFIITTVYLIFNAIVKFNATQNINFLITSFIFILPSAFSFWYIGSDIYKEFSSEAEKNRNLKKQQKAIKL